MTNHNNNTLRLITGILQIVFSVGLILLSAVLLLIFGIVEGLAEGFGGELSGSGIVLLNITRYSLVYFALIGLTNGILLLVKDVSKVIVSSINIALFAIIAVLFFFLQTSVFYAFASLPIVMMVLNVFTLINENKINREKLNRFNSQKVEAEEIIVE